MMPAPPKRAVRVGDTRADLVKAIQTRLDALGCGPLAVDGVFGAETAAAVKLLQTRRGETVDGIVGPATWAALFGAMPAPPPAAGILQGTILIAISQIGVVESGGANRGPQVDEYLRSVGIDPTTGSYPWCAAFVHWCFSEEAAHLAIANPCPAKAGCLALWGAAPVGTRIAGDAAFDDPTLVRAGAVFIIDHGYGKGHAGLVEAVDAGRLVTIEGNTNPAGGREGYGVFRRQRAFGEINIGFLDFGR
jgi:peptidoglycan hydrolase-like protein with peptidoglycan-binding domain